MRNAELFEPKERQMMRWLFFWIGEMMALVPFAFYMLTFAGDHPWSTRLYGAVIISALFGALSTSTVWDVYAARCAAGTRSSSHCLRWQRTIVDGVVVQLAFVVVFALIMGLKLILSFSNSVGLIVGVAAGYICMGGMAYVLGRCRA